MALPVLEGRLGGLVAGAFRVLSAAASRGVWVVGFSGGKDSSVLLDLVLRFLGGGCPGASGCPSKVLVVYSDTLLEPPPLRGFARSVLEAVAGLGLGGVEARVVEPAVGEDLVAMVLVRGYPAPSARFRWCTDRWKTGPARRLLRSVVGGSAGEGVAVLSAARAEEAAHRAARRPGPGGLALERDDVGGAAFVPLHEWRVGDVWGYMEAVGAPAWGAPGWGALRRVYAAAAGARMGCWACTLVSRDRGWEALAAAGLVDPVLVERLGAWRSLWLHLSRGRPELWRLPKARLRRRRGGEWRYRYGKLRPEARLLLYRCLEAVIESSPGDPVVVPLAERLALYRDVLEGLEEHRRGVEELLVRDPVAAGLARTCMG